PFALVRTSVLFELKPRPGSTPCPALKLRLRVEAAQAEPYSDQARLLVRTSRLLKPLLGHAVHRACSS
ncbi:MAG: hypothetical protein ACPG4T_11840, partial [Nannocystaceae bacterium]